MKKVAAPLAAALLATVGFISVTACGGSGAEPGASDEATRPVDLVLDFQPNAVHTGIYAALARDYYEDVGLELSVREPSASTDAPKLLQAGRAQFAILDIHDLGLAREEGFDVVGLAAIVQRPLAAVLARSEVRRPRDLEGKTVGVTGLPSDDAVLDSVLEADGADPRAVDRVTIGFNAVSALAAGKVDAATGFWNAEGVALRRAGTEIREFRVDDYGAPPYPELVLVTSRKLLEDDPELVEKVVGATVRGYGEVLGDPPSALDDLLAAVPSLDRGEQEEQLRALLPAFEPPGELDPEVLGEWGRWDVDHGILPQLPRPGEAFALELAASVAGE